MTEPRFSNNSSEKDEYLVLIPEIARTAKVRPEILREWLDKGLLPRPIRVGQFRMKNGVPWRPKGEGYLSSQVPEVLQRIAALKPRWRRLSDKEALP